MRTLLLLLGLVLCTADSSRPRSIVVVATQAFYVSPKGSDSNEGKSLARPFLTLEKAQTAMRNSSTVKTTYLMEGTFNRTQELHLTISDNGESWLAYPGQRPILNGRNSVDQGIYIIADNISIKGLTIENYTSGGIYSKYSNNLLLDSNTVLNITSPDSRFGTNNSSIYIENVKSGTITHNLVNGNTNMGIEVMSARSESNADTIVTYNEVYNVCSSVNDCGAIYLYDPTHSVHGLAVLNNIVGNYGPNTSNESKGIYLDYDASWVTVQNNIVYGTGQYAIQIHGGNDISIMNNIFDISRARKLGLYQDCTAASCGSTPNYGMTNNVFQQNIVYSSGAFPSAVWDCINQSGGTIANPADSNNLYHNPADSFPNGGTKVDARPTVGDPGFSNPSSANYSLTTRFASDAIGFQAIDQRQMGPSWPYERARPVAGMSMSTQGSSRRQKAPPK